MKTKDKEKLIRKALNEFTKDIDTSSIRHKSEGIFFISNGYHYLISNQGYIMQIGSVVDIKGGLS